jgi:hypothetical protein
MIAIITNYDHKNNRIVTHCDYGLYRFPISAGLSLDESRNIAVMEINRRFYERYKFNQVSVLNYPNKRDKKIHVIELC